MPDTKPKRTRTPKAGTKHYLLRNVSLETLDTLAADAVKYGQSLQEYLRRLLNDYADAVRVDDK